MNVLLSSLLVWAFTHPIVAFAFSSSSSTSTSSSSPAAFYNPKFDTKHKRKTLLPSTTYTTTSTLLFSSTASSSSSSSSHDDRKIEKNRTFLRKLLGRLRGDFDNYPQVLRDRKRGLAPRESGGHEQFHCTFLPISPKVLPSDVLAHDVESCGDSLEYGDYGAVLASYYLDGMPKRIFRLRLYVFRANHHDDNNNNDDDDSQNDEKGGEESESDVVMMKIYALHPNLERELRLTGESSVEAWGQILKDQITTYSHHHHNHQEGEEGDKEGCTEIELFQELKRCDIKWTTVPHPVRHSFLPAATTTTEDEEDEDGPFHAIMIHDHDVGGVKLASQLQPGTYLRVRDELSLWGDELWINDRGYDAETEEMVYGNWRGIPYKMKRVASLVGEEEDGDGDDDDGEVVKWRRSVVDSSLEWTLGSRWRTEEEYEEKMNAIGGINTKLR